MIGGGGRSAGGHGPCWLLVHVVGVVPLRGVESAGEVFLVEMLLLAELVLAELPLAECLLSKHDGPWYSESYMGEWFSSFCSWCRISMQV